MKIESSMIAMQSQHAYMSYTSQSLNTFRANLQDAKDLASAKASQQIAENQETKSSQESALMQVQKHSLFYLFELLFANHKNWYHQLFNQYALSSQSMNYAGGYASAFSSGNYMMESYHYEQEVTTFSTTGTVVTADGREISFGLNLQMSRSFEEYYREEMQGSPFDLCDPLVINLDSDIAQLTDQTFLFDLDADGKQENISMLAAGSGYLALDKNGDGKITDGLELFGAKSQDGFADLAAYDEDQNGWIDENDAVFSKLKIWAKDASGNDILYSLKEKGVGAIGLANVSTDFTERSASKVNGAIRSSGIFLYETGGVGSVQHVDVAKYASIA
ncbi:hypothetical protein [Eubacterium oxidoreducens]|uniref:VCBS repeat-containing protein n=1 Tax=Eubacterium oxidoreducens TaxID=1732 RepID=A0A1G6AX86_EUBOX|nr:hypothetical protein [Eubacterium oxidoreducens]SDB12899.1 hypothetical protein SAMN02910417_00985 [Eubacterium oxidoreducens]